MIYTLVTIKLAKLYEIFAFAVIDTFVRPSLRTTVGTTPGFEILSIVHFSPV